MVSVRDFDYLLDNLEDYYDYLELKEWDKVRHKEKIIPFDIVKKKLFEK